MEIPKGFAEIVKLVMKEPPKKIDGPAIWDCYVQAALIGGGRSEADINFIIDCLNKSNLLKLETLQKLDGDKWEEEAEKILKNKLAKLEYEEDKKALNNLLKELFRITASLKGSARFFERKNVIQKIDEYTKDQRAEEEFIEEIADDEDVSNVRQTKVMLWLHSIGRGKNSIPATRQVKSFINSDIGPYHPYYDDDKYFLKKAYEFVDEVKKKVKGSTASDVSRSIFYYIGIKSMVPRGYGKAFTCDKFLNFLSKNKFTLKKLSEVLGDVDSRMKLMEKVDKYSRNVKQT